MSDADKSKSTPLPWLLLTGILGVFAVNTPQSTTPAPIAKKTEEKKTDEPAKVAIDDPLKPVVDFHRSRPITMTSEQELSDEIHGYKTEFMIATVPDPIDTAYGYAFDQAVDAVQRAIEKKDGYILDRCWLPWELDRKAKPKPGEPPSVLRETKPGVLLFRHGRDRSKSVSTPGLCVVFLVGETPMGGIHKQAFHKALRMMTDVGHPVSAPIRVIGPYFSGSQTSLQFAVGDWWAQHQSFYSFGESHPPYRFEVITGNATAIRKTEFFGYEANKENFPAWRPNGIDFSSTVIPTRTTLGALLHFLTERDGSGTQQPIPSGVDLVPGKVAILAEGNTGFGKSFANINKDQIVTLRFPLHISRVKNEYTQATKEKDRKAGLAEDDPLLALTITDDVGAAEGVPAQGGSTTTAANGQVLSRILATISREQCRYVGVVASDTRDKLFLIRLIREHCPDVRIFVTDGDLLLTHPEYRYHMRGVLIGSTYPLVPRNQNWVKGANSERILFPSVGAQGYYNATLMQLGLPDQLLEYSAPRFALRDPNAPEEASVRPPIWISMVAPNGSIVPLHLYTKYEDKSSYVARREQPQINQELLDGRSFGLEYPGSMLPVGLGLLAGWSYLIARAWKNPHARLFWRGGSLVRWPDLFYRNIILGSQVLLAVPVLCAVWTHAEAKQYTSFWGVAFVVTTMLAMLGLGGGMVRPLCRRGVFNLFRGRPLPGESGILAPAPPDSRLERLTWMILNLSTFIAVFGFAALCLYRFYTYGDFARRSLFFVRAVDLSTGLSPLTPLFFVCLAYAAWGFFQLKRTHVAERYHVPNPYPETPEFERIINADRVVRDEICHEAIALKHFGSITGAVLALVGFGIAVWMQSLPTVEGWAWDLIFFVGFAWLFLLSSTTLIRLFFVWRTVKQLLDAIAALPMMRAFGGLPTKVTEVFGRYLFTQKPQLSHLQVPAHQLRLLVAEVEKDETAPAELRVLGPAANEIEATLSAALAAGGRGGAARRAERDVRDRLSSVAGTCISVLAPRGRWLPVDEAFGGGQGKEEIKRTDGPAWVRQAETVAATQVVVYLSQFFVQLRNLVWAAVVTSSLLLMAATSYPFHPEKLLLIGLIGLSGAGMAGVMYVLVEMNRDEVVSRVTKSTPGKFSLDSGFLGSFFTYIVPAAGIMTAQLSGSFRWALEPLLRVMK